MDTLQFRLHVNADNEAFATTTPEAEIARILRATADRLAVGEDFGGNRNLQDSNGNSVGWASLKYQSEHERGFLSVRDAGEPLDLAD